MSENIRILLADDHKIIRDGLRTLVEKMPDMTIAGEAKNGREAVRLARKLIPDVVIMDVSMVDLNGIEATRQIHKEQPGIKVIALSMHSDRRFVRGMLEAGAFGYLLKDCAFEELARAIKTVVSKKTYLSPEISDIIVKDFLLKSSAGSTSAYTALTARQREVLQLLAEGKSTRQIAKSLHVSIKTIETHRRQIMDKLNIHSIAELTKYALREGLTSLEA
jgi:DNA-binding NarL/FixJ family response regulator